MKFRLTFEKRFSTRLENKAFCESVSVKYIIREYSKSDINDLINANYPIENSTELGDTYNMFKSKIIDALQGLETRRLVLYDQKQKKTVGIVTLKKVNKNLWGIWDIFVAPSHRGHRLSVHLYKAAFSYLQKRGAKKAFGSVDIRNIPSRKTIERVWDGYLPQKYYRFFGRISIPPKRDQNKITIKSTKSVNKNVLFSIYARCVSKEWRTFLEIDKSNFLGFQRILPGVPTLLEGSLRYITPKQILVAERYKRKIEGYAITKRNITPIIMKPASLYLFLSPNLSLKDALAIFRELISFLLLRGFTRFDIFSINLNEKLLEDLSMALEKRLNVSRFLVCVKNLD